MTRDQIEELIHERGLDEEDIVLFTGLEDAFVGLAERFGLGPDGGEHRWVAVYDWRRIIELHVAAGMDYDDAVEYVDYNVIGAYCGPGTPAILYVNDETA